jgi:OmcA/MtrC family decaheme c-type cytochrome
MGKMIFRTWSSFFLVLLLAVTVGVLSGCSGDDGKDGADGAPGLSAYELAVDGGFVGTEEEWLASLEAAAPETDESCTVCHGEDSAFDVAEAHPMLEKPIVSDIVVARSAGEVLTVTFTVTDADGDPVTGIGSVAPSDGGDIRVYMAAIVPAGTPTANLPKGTWTQDYLEIWTEERGSGAGVVLTEPTPGNYSFQMVATVADIGPGGDAPEAVVADTMRVYVRADARDQEGFNRTMGVADFIMPAAGADTGVIDTTTRTVVTMEACTQCHGDPLERAAHGGGYQSPQVCNMCHSPIGVDGDEMQAEGFWLANLIHAIHQESPDMTTVDFSEVTYPRHPSDCAVCHFDAGQDAYAAWTNPRPESCGTCHNSVDAQDHMAAVDPAVCVGCHTAGSNLIGGVQVGITAVHAVTTLKGDPAHEGNVVTNVHNYVSTLTITAPANGTHYVAGEAPMVTLTTDGVNDGEYANPAGPFTAANIYVYGPRANAVPVLTPGSTTDPAFDPATMTADQGRSMLIGAAAGDAQVLTDATGFKYQLQAIPDDMEAGTYMVMAYATDLTDCSGVYRGSVCIDGWVLENIQIGSATETPKVAGDCSGCHDAADWTTFYHRSYFGTDGCIACHDNSGNHADPIANRVHAVHAASATGDLLGADWSGADPDLEAPTFPRNAYACEACHTSGNESYLGAPTGNFGWGVPCIGCHGDTDGAKDHMIQMGTDFSTWEAE